MSVERLTRAVLAALALWVAAPAATGDNPEQLPEPVIESAARAHAMLTRLCDDFGGRLTGTPPAQAALARLALELRALGLEPKLRSFSMPGWERGDDRVELLTPVPRKLRAAAFGYVQPHPAFEADLVNLGAASEKEWPVGSIAGAVGLITSSSSASLRATVELAQVRGLRGLLYGGRESGGQLLLRTGSHVGEPLPVPVYALTDEEARWCARRLQRGEPMRVRLETRSRCRTVETANLSVTLKGRAPERIVVGAHFDSWDIGQGAIDNGLGVAQLFALADALRERKLERTVELIWFNGEEQGLWGSREQAARLGDTPIIAMINLDMVGVPQAVNALGDESLVPWLEQWNARRGDGRLPLGVQNNLWTGSDHTPFQLAGVRAITFHGPIDRESVRYYHDFADTIDKLPVTIVADSAKVISDLVVALANDASVPVVRRSAAETERMFVKAGVDQRLRGLGWWPFP
ncbi:M28 family metallopeptidase [Opitutus terrae]|uniref:Carboxypeptidase Q n=1 Tax=Opitutus terrae (strain DSM 11246 / JCM 15787 / PB90-1) TaxID=452637 RepID=B1ZY39_OPITP|nr:M28 family metallopeptidase [Opitutus terrae]ACB76188.1 peptidase M28 [Opitutus terrae PB90-1]